MHKKTGAPGITPGLRFPYLLSATWGMGADVGMFQGLGALRVPLPLPG